MAISGRLSSGSGEVEFSAWGRDIAAKGEVQHMSPAVGMRRKAPMSSTPATITKPPTSTPTMPKPATVVNQCHGLRET